MTFHKGCDVLHFEVVNSPWWGLLTGQGCQKFIVGSRLVGEESSSNRLTVAWVDVEDVACMQGYLE